ncbi:aromatic amino acid transaminase [Burkholderia anthina]|uniref:amino acid aminotransferase n=1 Tax=Burkholderia anthina TaxID=179879 RepID=UPI00158A9847|nr:amino acid aminotransferase [Burkholderia anthina]
MFDHVEKFPGDPILSLVEAFNADSRQEKVNLSIGIYYDNAGSVPTLQSVIEAERSLQERALTSPSYLPMEGMAEFRSAVQRLLLGDDSGDAERARLATIQTLGGSGALKVGADFLHRYFPTSTVYVSDYTWDNHVGIFQGAGFAVGRYRYFDTHSKGVDFDGMLSDLSAMHERSIVVLHPCCHNPTGADLTPSQWDKLITVVLERNLIPFLDMAYQGFGDGIDDDAYAIRAFARAGIKFFLSNSFSKIFSLYNERIGALSVVCADEDEAVRVLGQLKSTVRTNYSSPPATGARLVSAVLLDEGRNRAWREEVNQMHGRIKGMRQALRSAIETRKPDADVAYLTSQRGMFSFTGLSTEQVNVLRADWGVYLVGNGRLCVAGLTERNAPRVAEALVGVL